MSIRLKLLLAFFAVIAVPLAILLAMAMSYWRGARAALDQRFLEEAKRVGSERGEAMGQ